MSAGSGKCSDMTDDAHAKQKCVFLKTRVYHAHTQPVTCNYNSVTADSDIQQRQKYTHP